MKFLPKSTLLSPISKWSFVDGKNWQYLFDCHQCDPFDTNFRPELVKINVVDNICMSFIIRHQILFCWQTLSKLTNSSCIFPDPFSLLKPLQNDSFQDIWRIFEGFLGVLRDFMSFWSFFEFLNVNMIIFRTQFFFKF